MQRIVFSELGVQIMSWRYSDNKGTLQWRILTWTIIQHTTTSVRGVDRTGPSSSEINFSTCDGNIKERLKVESIAERCMKARLRWFVHVKRRDQEYVGRKTMEMVPPGRRKRGRPKQRWMDYVNRDMRAIGTTSDMVHDRTGWRRIVSAAATPQPSGIG